MSRSAAAAKNTPYGYHAIETQRSTLAHHPPVFHVQELLQGQRIDELSRVLSETGLIAVVDSPIEPLMAARYDSLQGLCSCLQSPSTKSNDGTSSTVRGVDSSVLADGTTRITLATATVGDQPMELPEHAGCQEAVPSMEALRDHVAVASHAFVHALDRILQQDNGGNENTTVPPLLDTLQGKEYRTMESIIRDAQHLEHFHVYSNENKQSSPQHQHDDTILEPHTDAGLFLAFAPGHSCDDDMATKNDSGLYLHDHAEGGRPPQLVELPPGSVGIMLGVGSEHWLRTTSTTVLRATRHSVVLPPGQKRAWYGMSTFEKLCNCRLSLGFELQYSSLMFIPSLSVHLVPPDAVVNDVPRRTFGELQQAMANRNSRTFGSTWDENESSTDDDSLISFGCGSTKTLEQQHPRISSSARVHRRRLGTVDDASFCNNATSFFCWSNCLDIPDYENAEAKAAADQSLYCLDPATLARTGNVTEAVAECTSLGIVGNNHNHACVGMWENTAEGVPSQTVDVSAAALAAASQQFCYGGTSMYMDGFHWTDPTCVIYLFPAWVLSSRASLVGASLGTILFGVATEAVVKYRRVSIQAAPPGWKRLGVSSAMYGLQLTMGYLIMLVVMTYSLPLFMSVVFGFMCGHVLLNWDQVSQGKEITVKESASSCCCDGPEASGATAGDGIEDCCGGGTDTQKNDICVPEGCTPCCQNAL